MKSDFCDYWICEKFCYLRLWKELIIVDKFIEVLVVNIILDWLIRLLFG